MPPEFSGNQRFPQQEIKDFCAALEIPFDPGVIDWRVTNTTKNGKLRGHVIPYADQRAYTDRLHGLFTPAGWTRKYAIHTSANLEQQRPEDRCQGAGPTAAKLHLQVARELRWKAASWCR